MIYEVIIEFISLLQLQVNLNIFMILVNSCKIKIMNSK